MIRKKLAAILAMTAMVAMIQTAQATFLGDLVNNNGSITIGDKTFSGFSWFSANPQLNAQAASLDVTAYILGGTYYLDYGGLLSVNNGVVGDVVLKYTVTAAPGWSIWMIDQNYTVNALPLPGNQIIIGETVKNVGGVIVGNSTLTLNPNDLSDPITEVGDNLLINPNANQLFVVKDILLASGGPNQLVGLSDVQQSFHQVPEPTTMIAGALLLLPFGASTIRFFRKNRTA